MKTALEWWPTAAIRGDASVELPLPRQFEQLAEMVGEDQIVESLTCGPDPEPLLEKIRTLEKAGYTQVYLHQVGPDQEGFLRFAERELLPKVAWRSAVSRRPYVWTKLTRKLVPPLSSFDVEVRVTPLRTIFSFTVLHESLLITARWPAIVANAPVNVIVENLGSATGLHEPGQLVAGASTIHSAVRRGAPGAGAVCVYETSVSASKIARVNWPLAYEIRAEM